MQISLWKDPFIQFAVLILQDWSRKQYFSREVRIHRGLAELCNFESYEKGEDFELASY